ncbi:DUF4190 domain-containing protein [Streptacidiphilus sp. EB129]|uniref:DUF4190 domain-containing protein n=1 Tax=Streptacidiphilus sp. EB129 TaxID=3156262 RepID=UPI003513B840
MPPQNAPIPPASTTQPPVPATSGLPSYPRQTELGYYGARQYGPNGKALTAFILSLAGGGLISIVLAVIALGQIRDTGQSGRGLAIAALVLSVLWLPFEILGVYLSATGS